jgi:hypothetical protein
MRVCHHHTTPHLAFFSPTLLYPLLDLALISFHILILGPSRPAPYCSDLICKYYMIICHQHSVTHFQTFRFFLEHAEELCVITFLVETVQLHAKSTVGLVYDCIRSPICALWINIYRSHSH